VHQFEITPKAFANFEPRVRACENPGTSTLKGALTLKGFANLKTLSGFGRNFEIIPRVLEDSNPGLELANAFGVFHQIST